MGQRQDQLRPDLIAALHVERQATDHPVAIHRQIHVAEAGGGLGQRRGRLADPPGGAVFARRIDQQGQIDVLCARQRRGQGWVSGFRLGEQNVVGDGARTGLGQSVDQVGVDRARPRPATERLQATVVDGDDDDRFVGRAVLKPDQGVIGQIVSSVGGGAQRQPADDQGGQGDDQAPLDQGAATCQPGAQRPDVGHGSASDAQLLRLGPDLQQTTKAMARALNPPSVNAGRQVG
ncbi:hypothetical protein D3C87_1457840 [compost metagenome]